VLAPGSLSGFKEKIPYLKELGVTAVELLPIFEFDEHENVKINPLTGRQLTNYWGYSSVSFFSPKASYAAGRQPDSATREFKELVKELHRAGLEVILDVVYNHTAEGDNLGPTFCFRGLDNTVYYMLDGNKRYYRNYSGCGNTFNCNHPLVREFVLDSLRYWVIDMHVDGFRFDLASILGRAQDGSVLSNPPLLERIAHDPILADCKIIAEAWDAAGLYQVGSFPAARRWAEWNARFRDDVRKFIRGDPGLVAAIATRVGGSSDLYQHDGRSPHHSINFVTSHDGFTMADLVAYNQKHNEANGEDNRDGMNDNYCWNCGAEGDTSDPLVITLRQRQIKNFWTVLMSSQGVPMILGGDECGRTQRGNNNAYCQDNEVSWFDWTLLEKNHEIVRFAREAIHFRRNHPALTRHSFLVGRADGTSAESDISWHGLHVGAPDWSAESRLLAFMLLGAPHLTLAEEDDDDIYVCFNMDVEARTCDLPPPRAGRSWHRAIDTSLASPEDIAPQGQEPRLTSQDRYRVHARSSIVLVAR
jgi:glycogen operon protein